MSSNRKVATKSPYVSRPELYAWYLRRAGIPAIRGLIRSPWYKTVGQPLALGKSVQVFGGRYLNMGSGVVIGDYSKLSCYSVAGVSLEENVTLREFAWIQCSSSLQRPLGQGIRVGRGTYIGPRSYLGVSGFVDIGQNCDIGGGFTVIAENHSIPNSGIAVRKAGTEARGVVIGDDCWMGNNVTILDGVSVGAGAVIGAGSVVTRDLPANSVSYGVPAKTGRMRDVDRYSH
jgi:acetyltransferase-like isoleucine patch superfamily enzyme